MARFGHLIFNLVLVGALCAVVLWRIDLDEVGATLADVEWAYAPIPVVCLIAALALRSWRLAILLNCNARFLPVFNIACVGLFVNQLLPLRAGELAMTLLLKRKLGIQGSRALSVIALDRLLDMAVVLMLFMLSLLAVPGVPDAAAKAGVIFAVVIGATLIGIVASLRYKRRILRVFATLIAYSPIRDETKWLERVETFIDGLAVLRVARILAPAVTLSVLAWGCAIVALYYCLAAAWPTPDWAAATFAICLTVFGMIVVAVPAGVGVIHTAIMFALAAFAVPKEIGLAAATVYHLLGVAVAVGLGAWSLRAVGFSLGGLMAMARRGSDEETDPPAS